jgi:hypothetical protein
MKAHEIAKHYELNDFQTATLIMAAALSSGKETSQWKSVYCSEHETNEWTEAEACEMSENAVVTTTVNHPSDGSYICIDIGSGWFSWGIGDVMASAICEFFKEVERTPLSHPSEMLDPEANK